VICHVGLYIVFATRLSENKFIFKTSLVSNYFLNSIHQIFKFIDRLISSFRLKPNNRGTLFTYFVVLTVKERFNMKRKTDRITRIIPPNFKKSGIQCHVLAFNFVIRIEHRVKVSNLQQYIN